MERLQATIEAQEKQLSLTYLITHIIIEDTNRKTIRIAKGKELTAKANLVESHNKRYDSSNKNNKKTDYKPNSSNPKFKKRAIALVAEAAIEGAERRVAEEGERLPDNVRVPFIFGFRSKRKILFLRREGNNFDIKN
ncbi:Integrase, catalytic core [Senna tora]|uniref:Integrase, catalytic core n=1 Tax=Senna tora TaxID=362788 RepID=A0A834WVW3_9FABA|nr:Integrase, catalytic core [Senna tora]